MTQVIFNQKNRMLLRFQRKNLIESSSSTSDSDNNRNDPLKLMENNNPMLRLIAYGKLKHMMMSYSDQKLKSIDKNLLKGIYTRKLKDFKEDYVTNFGNKSLFARLKSEFLSVT